MKKIIFYLLIFCFESNACGQEMPGSLKEKHKPAKANEKKGKILYANIIRPSAADSIATAHAVDLINLFKKENDEADADYMELYLGAVIAFK